MSIEVDGKRVGTTPTTLVLRPGMHIVTMRKQDFGAWEETVTQASGKTGVAANMHHVGPTLR
jgi:hypothetical protein